MRNILTSASVLAIGATALHAYDPDFTRARTGGRPWSVSGTVRGFYDDNPTTSPDKIRVTNPLTGRTATIRPEDSFGIEVSPAVYLNLPMEQTFVSLGYVYSLRYYEDREHDTDQSHEFTGRLAHQFSPRHDISVDDSFIITQEPTVAEGTGGIITTPTRVQTRTDSDILRNRGAIAYNVWLTEVLGVGLGYVNTFYDYEQDGPGSRSALLDRMEHLFRADGKWQVNPSLVGIVGYQFGINDYTGDELLFAGTGPAGPMSEIRDTYSHYFYVGADHDFNTQLRGSVRLGVQYTDYHNTSQSDTSPYVDAGLTYAYAPGSSLRAGVKHQRSATDVAAVSLSGRPTLDAESTAVYAQLSHRITGKLVGGLLAQYQTSTFNEGAADDKSEDIFMAGLMFEYYFTPHWSAHLGYNYDILESDLQGRDYDRNRVYVGVRATY